MRHCLNDVAVARRIFITVYAGYYTPGNAVLRGLCKRIGLAIAKMIFLVHCEAGLQCAKPTEKGRMQKRNEREEFLKVLSFGRGGVDSLPAVRRLSTGVGEGFKLAPPAIKGNIYYTILQSG